MTVEELRSAFPEGMPFPTSLEKLAAYEETTDGFVVCDFELSPRAQGQVAAALGAPDAVAANFAMFGRDGMHSLYGLWRYDERPLEQAPVVYVSGEGVGTSVIAGSLDEFLSLLAIGKEAIGWVDQWSEGECEGVDRYRHWLRSELGLEPPSDPRGLVERARAAHPDLRQWVSEHSQGG